MDNLEKKWSVDNYEIAYEKELEEQEAKERRTALEAHERKKNYCSFLGFVCASTLTIGSFILGHAFGQIKCQKLN